MNSSDWLKGLTTILRQFRLPTALRLVTFETARKLFDPWAVPSYAQTGEDRAIDFYVGYPETGFYVDVGCHHPVRGSNTFRLYRRGWHGLCVDANGDCIQRFRKVRPRDIAVEATVSDAVRDVEYVEFDDTRVSSISPEFVKKVMGQHGVRPTARRLVRTITLTELCRRYEVPGRFDLLSVDCEGHDLEVLRSLDFSLFRPRLVVVEAHSSALDGKGTDPICEFLARQGYDLRGYLTKNAYFTERK